MERARFDMGLALIIACLVLGGFAFGIIFTASVLPHYSCRG